MRKLCLLPILVIFSFLSVQAQNIGINADGSVPHASAMLDVSSTSKGLLIPRVVLTSTTDATTISNPATSLLVYNTTNGGTGSTAVQPGFYQWSGTAWLRLTTNGNTLLSPWVLGGNVGTNPTNNFIGTVDNQPLSFKINNVHSGRIDQTNSFFGYTTGSNTTGVNNTAMGALALSQNTTGDWNTAFGFQSLQSNTTGIANTAIGFWSLIQNKTGHHNTALGGSALELNESGNYNTASGQEALYGNKTGDYNAAYSIYSLRSNTSGSHNSAYGSYSMYHNTEGSSNTAIGLNSLQYNQLGNFNTAVGTNALVANVNGSNNSAFGYNANVASGDLNNATAIGAYSRVDCSNCLVLGSVNGVNSATSNANVGIGTNIPSAGLHVQNNTVLFSGTLNLASPGTLPASGAGTRLLWIPTKAALRVGMVEGDQWDMNNIGNYSIAMGPNAKGSGSHSTAIGPGTIASGPASTALGSSSKALGSNSVAIGVGATAEGLHGTAFGYNTRAGDYATAMGNTTVAIGAHSTAMGHTSHAGGGVSTAIGYGTIAKAFSSLSVGEYNDDSDNPQSYVNAPTDRIFQIGNGTPEGRSNALTILRNGEATFHGNVKINGVFMPSSLRATNSVLFSGTINTTTPSALPATGAGTRLLWYPDKSAFRVGTVNSSQWDLTNIGNYSTAIGPNTTASGPAAVAIGDGAIASETNAISIGGATASGPGAVAIGSGLSNGVGTFTIGNGAKASGWHSKAFGSETVASGGYALAMGTNTVADGAHSATLNHYTTALGGSTTALGDHTVAKANSSLVIGSYNDISDNPPLYSRTPTDRVFQIGNGEESARSNAMTVFRNGNVTIAGVLTQNSDLRLKTGVVMITNALSKLNTINGYNYRWSDSRRSQELQSGIIAQEVQKVMPELVREDEKGLLSVNYSGLIPLLIQAVKEQQQQIEKLSKENEELKVLKARIEALEKDMRTSSAHQ